MQRKIEILGAEVVCDFLKDSFLFDTMDVAPGENEIDFYTTKAAKSTDMQNFHAEGRLVQDDRILETITIICRLYGNAIVEEFDLKSIFEFASFVLEIDENIEDKDNLLRVAGGVDVRSFVEPGNFGFLDRAFVGDGTHLNVRVYAKHRMVPGGKTTKFMVRFPRAGGSQNVITRELQTAFYGYELKPRKTVGAAK